MNSLPQNDRSVNTDRIAAGLIRSMLNDSYSPNGVTAADCGPWSGIVSEVLRAFDDAGADGARAAFEAAAKGNPSLYRLASGDLDQGGPGAVHAGPAKKRGAIPKSDKIRALLSELGYSFRLNDLDDTIEVNGKPISDGVRAEIRVKLRDQGLKFVGVAEDVYISDAYHAAYNPILEFLTGLRWDGIDHIGKLAGYVTDRYADNPIDYGAGVKRSVFHAFTRRWLIGAVGKVLDQDENFMLVLDGEQGLGKSYMVRRLCSPLPDAFVEAPINPDQKDADILALRKLVWEVAELGATVRRSDLEALKYFISRRWVDVRVPYGRYPIRKPSVASFVGTINNAGGFLNDPTGSRRFAVCTLESIDWKYADAIDFRQVWAQAVALYRGGERGALVPAESARRNELNSGYEMPNSIDWYFTESVEVTGDFADVLPFGRVVSAILAMGFRGSQKQVEMTLSAHLHTLGIEKQRREKGNVLIGVKIRQIVGQNAATEP